MERHKLLNRQIKRFLPKELESSPEVEVFLDAINESYCHYEENRILLERTMDLNSGELEALLEKESSASEKQKSVLAELKSMLDDLQNEDTLCQPVKEADFDIYNLTTLLKKELALKERVSDDLIEEQTNLTALIENRSDVIFSIDTNYKIIIYNTHFYQGSFFRLGKKPQKGESILDIFPEDLLPDLKSLFDKSFKGDKFSIETDFVVDGTKRYFHISYNSIIRDEKVTGATILIRDITLKKEQEIIIIKNLEEKEVLLKEIHHRVKNNMQVIVSLLSLQSRKIRDKESKELFKDSQYRIQSMAMIHEMLYKSGDFQKINYKKYIENLMSTLVLSLKGIDHNINVNIQIDDIYLGLDSAIPLGLLINEIVTNSLKHGLKSSGNLDLKIKSNTENNYTLFIGDNGVGMPVDFEINDNETLGLKLVEYLTEQIEGEIKQDLSVKGTNYVINFNDLLP